MIEEFLSAIWPAEGPWGEVRAMRPGFPPRQDWLAPGHEAWPETVSGLDQEGWDVYYGVLPRHRWGGTAADCVDKARVLWADVDAKHTGGKHPALAGLFKAHQTPSIIVDSGHGYHAYWLLRQPVPFERAQAAMKALAREVQGDHTYDQARILRVPGTTNRKDPAKPVPVRLIYWDIERKYRIDDFEVLPPAPAVYVPEIGRELKLDLPSWLTEKLQTAPAKGNRSEAVFSAVLWLVRYGWHDDAITSVIVNGPLGEKYHEKGRDGDRWLKSTIKAARRAANE